jgi:AcrR family transcriptional regulator
MASGSTEAIIRTRRRKEQTRDRRHRSAAERRQQIFAGALKCFEINGYHQTSIVDIATASNISSGLIYQHFKDKKDLLFQVIVDILEAYNYDVTNALIDCVDPVLRLQRAAIAYGRVIDRRIPASLFAYRESKSLERDRIELLKMKELQTNQLILNCILECKAAGLCNDVDTELATYWIVNASHAWGLKNWRLRKITSFEEYIRQTLTMIFRGILNEEGQKRLAADNLLDGRPRDGI